MDPKKQNRKKKKKKKSLQSKPKDLPHMHFEVS